MGFLYLARVAPGYVHVSLGDLLNTVVTVPLIASFAVSACVAFVDPRRNAVVVAGVAITLATSMVKLESVVSMTAFCAIHSLLRICSLCLRC